VRVESLSPGLVHPGQGWAVRRWIEQLETDAAAELLADDGTVACWRSGNRRYLAAWPEQDVLAVVLQTAAREADIKTVNLPDGLRVRRTANHVFAFNYSTEMVAIPDDIGGQPVLGQRELTAAGVAVLEL
jgi:beta-galactosidase